MTARDRQLGCRSRCPFRSLLGVTLLFYGGQLTGNYLLNHGVSVRSLSEELVQINQSWVSDLKNVE